MADEDTSPVPPPAEEAVIPPPEAAPAPTEPEAVQSEPEPETAQIPLNEPLPAESEPIPPASASAESSGATAPEPPPVATSAPVTNAPITTGNARDMFVKARAVIQVQKRKRLDKIMEALNTKNQITNDEVEKLLHVSDATATRYLSALEKDGKIKQVGKTGIGVVYTKI